MFKSIDLKNFLSNIAGQGLSGIIGILVLPIIFTKLGAEIFSIIAFFLLLDGISNLLDLGFNQTINREVSKYNAGKYSGYEIRCILKTYEYIFLTISFLFFLSIFFLSEVIYQVWFASINFEKDKIILLIKIFGLISATRLFQTIYLGALLGLKKHFSMNVVTSISAVLRWGGSAAILLVSNDLILFFMNYLLVITLSLISLLYLTYKNVPHSDIAVKAKFQYISNNKNFIYGLAAQSLLSVIMSQFDRLLISLFFSPKIFSLYMLVSSITFLFIRISNTIYQTFFPKLVSIYVVNKDKLSVEVSKAGKLISIVLAPLITLSLLGGNLIANIINVEPGLVTPFIIITALKSLGYFLNSFTILVHQVLIAMKDSIFTPKINLIFLPFYLTALFICAFYEKIFFLSSIYIVLNIAYLIAYISYFKKNYNFIAIGSLLIKFFTSFLVGALPSVIIFFGISGYMKINLTALLIFLFLSYLAIILTRFELLKFIFGKKDA